MKMLTDSILNKALPDPVFDLRDGSRGNGAADMALKRTVQKGNGSQPWPDRI